MLCRFCKREVDDDSLYCRYCGQPLYRQRQKKASLPRAVKKLADGTLSGQVMVGGKRIRITAGTEAEYILKYDAYKRGLISVSPSLPEITVRDSVTSYIESRRNRLKPKTIEQYEYIRDHRFSSLMNRPASDVTDKLLDESVEAELSLASRKGGSISPKTVIDAYRLVVTAIKRQRPDFRPTVTLPELQRKFPVVLTPEQVISAVHGTDMELPCLLAMQFAFSASEIRGLTKSKSIRNGKLYIVETVVDVNGTPIRQIGDKEPDRSRVFDITPRIQSLIDAVSGDIIEPRTAHTINQKFQKLLAEAGLPKMSFHKLRHIAATVMAEEHIPANVAQERGGWKTDDTMKKVYIHTFTDARLEADRKVNERIEKAYESVT